jgi:hypothetical protein
VAKYLPAPVIPSKPVSQNYKICHFSEKRDGIFSLLSAIFGFALANLPFTASSI